MNHRAFPVFSLNRKTIGIAIGAVCIIGMAVCLWAIISTLMDYKDSAEDYGELQHHVVSVSDKELSEKERQEALEEEIATQSDNAVKEEIVTEAKPQAEAASKNPDWWYKDVSIDFNKLHKMNPDIIAWIRFDHQDQVGIDYPVMYTHSNDDYIHTDIYGEYRKSGTLFFEAVIEDPLSDAHKKDIIYGHMMKNGSMFAPLKKFMKDASFYKNNQYFTIYKKDAAYRYRIFSCFQTTAGSDTYQYGFTTSDELYRAHIDTLKSRSTVHEYNPDYEHKVLTLSTCAKANSDQRIVINAELIDVK